MSVAVDASRWEAAGMIFAIGYYLEKYMPINISPAFLQYALAGIEPAATQLIPEFLNYLPPTERDIMKRAMEDFHSVDKEDVIDFYTDYGSSRMPNPGNILSELGEIARTVLIANTTYMAQSFRRPLTMVAPYLTHPLGDTTHLKPTFKNVWDNLIFPTEPTDRQRKQQKFMKDVFRYMTEEQLSRFLRFCTGIYLECHYESNIMVIHLLYN